MALVFFFSSRTSRSKSQSVNSSWYLPDATDAFSDASIVYYSSKRYMCNQRFWKTAEHFIQWSILLTFRLYNTIVFHNYNWYVSIWSIKFASPLTTCISIFSSSPARRPWCSNSLDKKPLPSIAPSTNPPQLICFCNSPTGVVRWASPLKQAIKVND